MHVLRHAIPRLLPLVILAVLTAACGPTATSPSPSLPLSPSPVAAVTSPEEAALLVIAQNPDFAGIGPRNPDLIGGCCFYEARPDNGGYVVTFEVGWGDCMAGCINKHVWTYAVTPVGDIGLVGETGDPIPPGGIPPGN